MASATDEKPILLTGASGALGRVLTVGLAQRGWKLRLTDRNPFPDTLPDGVQFNLADLADGAEIARLAEGCDAVVHFGGESREVSFEGVLQPNIIGIHNCYEAARRQGARMVLASSSHVVGFYERSVALTARSNFRPDGFYGLSKTYAELMGQLYWDKHQVSSICLRIGSCRREPTDRRMLSTWLSHGDLISLVDRSLCADVQGRYVIWGISRNRRMRWWSRDDRKAIAWKPADNADAYYDRLLDRISRNTVAERFQGGAFCTQNVSSGGKIARP